MFFEQPVNIKANKTRQIFLLNNLTNQRAASDGKESIPTVIIPIGAPCISIKRKHLHAYSRIEQKSSVLASAIINPSSALSIKLYPSTLRYHVLFSSCIVGCLGRCSRFRPFDVCLSCSFHSTLCWKGSQS